MTTRVAHLLPNMLVGGRERMVADLCRRSGADGVEHRLILYDPTATGARFPCREVVEHAVDRRAPDFVGALRCLLARERIDLLHAQGHIPAALAAPLALERPMVTTLHVALGHGWRWLPAIVAGLRRSREVTAVSADLARRFRPLAGRPIRVLPPTVDTARFRRRTERPRNAVFTVGIAARLHAVKRHRDLIDALRLLAASGVRCRLRIAGEGALAPELRQRAAGLDVRFEGHVEDMPTWLAGLDAFALVSDHEGTPLALLEAMAVGVPCIATDVGGIAAAAGGRAILVPRRRPAAIAIELERLLREGTARPI